MTSKQKTSWGKEASWYSDHLEKDDTYHAKVILPNLLRIIEPKRGQKVLEIGCGEGYFARALVGAGSAVTACDISKELIAIAKEKGGGVNYFVSPAESLPVDTVGEFDIVLAVLTLQNMAHLDEVMKRVAQALKKNGRFIFILNHPTFRVPQGSAWGYDDSKNVQYRRIDRYLSGGKVKIDMHPGKKGKTSHTYSFHRSLQDYMKLLRSAGFCITRLEEWISHKNSEPGPRAKVENEARKEFPLFMMIEASLMN